MTQTGPWEAYIVVARDHGSVAYIITDAVLGLIGINIVSLLRLLLCFPLLLVLTALGAFDIGYSLSAMLGSRHLALWWRFPS